MDTRLIIFMTAVAIWVITIQMSKHWLGTKLGDVLIILIGASSIYGFGTGCYELYLWLSK